LKHASLGLVSLKLGVPKVSSARTQNNDFIKVTTLGTNAPNIDFANPKAQTGNLVEIAGDYWLVDCGIGVLSKMYEKKINPLNIKKVFLTHLDHDHCTDLISLIWVTLIYRGGFRTRNIENSIHVYGPQGTKNFINSLFKVAFIEDPRSERIVENEFVIPHEIDESFEYKGNDYIITTTFVKHYIKTYAFKLEYKGKILVITGDVGGNRDGMRTAQDHRDLINLSKGADMMIIDSAHIRSNQLGEIAQESEVKKLVLSHFVPNQRNNLKNLIDGVKDVYKGQIIAADDLMEFVVN